MINLLQVSQLDLIDEETEKCIYLLLDEMTRGEDKYKKVIGVDMKIFEEVFFHRVLEMWEVTQRDQEADLEALYERLTSNCMRKFFQLMTVLINNCTDNAKVFKEQEL